MESKFKIGETGYYIESVYSEGRIWLKEPKGIFTPVVLGVGIPAPSRSSFYHNNIEIRDGYTRNFMEYNLFTRAEAEQKIKERPDLYSFTG